ERLTEVIFTFYRLEGVNAENVKEVFFKDRGAISLNLYAIHYRDLLGDYDKIPEKEIEEIIEEYKRTLSTPTTVWLKNVFSKYEVEYIIWDKKSDPSWQLEKYSFLKKEVDFGDISIYTVSKE